MTNRSRERASRKSAPADWRIRAAIFFAFIISVLACGLVWLVPIEAVQQRALNHAGNGAFAKFEAVGEAEFSFWLLRIALTLLSLLVVWVWMDLKRWHAWIALAGRGLLASTNLSPLAIAPGNDSFPPRARTIGWRMLLVAWMVLFAAHAVHAIGERIHEWPYFRFNSGEVVLPNISDSNRAVIRYLQQTTPPTARILVASDQKLFFLSYYLRPRTLLHRMHPDAEHVIPLKEQQRKLNAYRLDELTERDLAEMPHDYTLEYFEHPDLVDRAQVLNDSAWISFIRQRERNPALIPSYLVRLRAVGERRQ